MKIGLLSDAHGNAVATSACLTALRSHGVDRVFFLGDAVGYLPGETEVLARLRDAQAICLKGNHEAMLLGELSCDADREEVYRLRRANERLSESDRAWIASWPERREEALMNRRLLMVHGSPSEPLQGYVYPDSDLTGFQHLPYDVVCMGNTHHAFVARAGRVLVVNVGSCGLPRDVGDRLSYAVYDVVADRCELFRLPIDVPAVLRSVQHEPIHESVRRSFARRAAPANGRTGRDGAAFADSR